MGQNKRLTKADRKAIISARRQQRTINAIETGDRFVNVDKYVRAVTRKSGK